MGQRSPYSYAFVIIGLLFLLTQTLRMATHFLYHFASALTALLTRLLALPLTLASQYPITAAFWVAALALAQYRQPLLDTVSNFLRPILLVRCNCSICGEAKCEKLHDGCWHAYHKGCIQAVYEEAKDSICQICASMKCRPEPTSEQRVWRSVYSQESKYFLMLFVGLGLYDIVYPYVLQWLTT